MSVVVEATVTEEKLRQLLDEGTESAALDYKAHLDLTQTRDRVELAKDVAAMSARGGYIVVGVDNSGVPSNSLTAADVPLFDEARLRSVLRKWLPEPFVLLSQCHAVEGSTVALIYVGPHPDGLCVLRADGQFEDNGKSITVFRQGDVFARHGTSSERWTQEDVTGFREHIRRVERERWLEEMQPLIERIRRAELADNIAAEMPDALDARLPEAAFEDVLLQLLRRQDPIAIRRFVLSTRGEFEQALAGQPQDAAMFERLLHRVTALAAIALAYDAPSLRIDGIRGLVSAYEAVDGTTRLLSERMAAEQWLLILTAVEALGGLAVRLESWGAVRDLTLQSPETRDFSDYWRVWNRHALTMAARAGLFEGSTGSGLIARAGALAAELPAVRPDVAADSERLLTSLCQYDFLACVIGLTEYEDSSGRDFYPSFSRYYSERVAPVASRLITDVAFRGQIAPRTSDGKLAGAMSEIDRMAQSEGIRFSGWHGFPPSVESWIAEHTTR